MTQSLRVRLPLLISSLIAVSVAAFLWMSYGEVQRALLRAGQARAQSEADQLATLLAQSAERHSTEVRRAAHDPDVETYLKRGDAPSEQAARKRLAALTSAGQPAVELWDATGERRLVVPVPATPARPAPELPAMERPTTEGVGPFQLSGQVVFWSTVREVPATPADSGGASGSAGFVRSTRILMAANSDAIGKLVGAGALIKLGNLDGTGWSDLSKAVASPTIQVRPGLIDGDRASDGQPLVGAAAAIRDTPWIVLVEFPRTAIVGPARAFALRMCLVAAALVLFAAIAAYAVSSRITSPLAQLTHAAEAIAHGRFEERAPSTRRDEIGRLDAAFQAMAVEVKTTRQDLESRVEERTRGLRAMTEELEAFSYSVSHDLRAPLRHIAGFAALLQQRAGGQLDGEAARHLRMITEAAARMGRLVDELLAFSRMGRAEMLKTRVNLDEVVAEVVRDVQQDAEGRAIRWKTHPLPEVSADPAMLRLALTNLVANAVKYTSPRPVAEIEIGAQPGNNGERVVYVKDNGVGFDMKYAHRLFGVFQRLHGADEFEGTGIGLANVRRIVQRHGGRTWAEGAVDRGATFFISLPEEAASAH